MSHMSELSAGYEEWLSRLVDEDLFDDLDTWRVICPRCGKDAEWVDSDNGILYCRHCGACNVEDYLLDAAKEKYDYTDYVTDMGACEADRKYQERKEDGF